MRKEQLITKQQTGFSIVEVLLAGTIVAFLVTTLVGALIYGVETMSSAGNRARGTFLAEEGLEAARNLKDAGFANLTTGAHGLAISLASWIFSGTSDLTDNTYTRVINISDINASTKQVTSTVTWNDSLIRPNSVVLNSYLTNWRAASSIPGGIIVYGDTTATPKFRTYDTTANTFSAEASTVTGTLARSVIIRTSPTKAEAIAGYVNSSGVLQVMCYDGTSWSNEWSVITGSAGNTRPFDIAYETNSGKVMVLYSRNTAPANELAYRIKSGSSGCGSANWSAAADFDPVRTSGVVQWVKMAWDRRSGSNLITAIWADANSDLSAAVWSGSVWGNEPASALATTLQVVATAQDVEDFDVEYESLSGDVMVVWGIAVGNNTNGVRYSTCTNGTASCVWSAVATPPTFADDATNLDISANPDTDEMVFASIGSNQNDLQIGYWSGSAWTNTANADTSCNPPGAGTKNIATGWLISGGTTRSVIRYFDQGSSAIDWYTGNGGTFNKETDFTISPAPGGPVYTDIQMNPASKDQLMNVFSDGANDLFAKRLMMDSAPNFTWTNSDGTVLTATLSQSINSPFSFAFWRQ